MGVLPECIMFLEHHFANGAIFKSHDLSAGSNNNREIPRCVNPSKHMNRLFGLHDLVPVDFSASEEAEETTRQKSTNCKVRAMA